MTVIFSYTGKKKIKADNKIVSIPTQHCKRNILRLLNPEKYHLKEMYMICQLIIMVLINLHIKHSQKYLMVKNNIK